MKHELIAGGIGTGLAVLGTATQLNEVLQTISLIITILGALVSFVVVPLLSWYRNAKKDGKISLDEIEDAAKTLQDGINKTKSAIDGGQTDDEDKREEIKNNKGGNIHG